MAALKDKFKDLFSNNGETNIGGAPFHGDDFVKVQENAKANFINTKEKLRGRLGTMGYYRAGSPAEQLHSFGMVLSGLEYSNADPANPVINSGYLLSEGEVIYYPGGSFNTGGSVPVMVYLRKGNQLDESRNFDDGGSRVFAVEYEAELFVTSFNNFGPTNEPIPSADLTKEYVVIAIGGGPYFGFTNWVEDNCTEDAAFNLNGIEKRIEYGAFQDTALGAGWSTNVDYLDKMASRVDEKGFTYIAGSVKKTFAGGSTEEIVGTLGSKNLSWTGGPIFMNTVVFESTTADRTYNMRVTIDSQGVIRIKPAPGGSFPIGDLILYFNETIIGRDTVLDKSYTYNNNFMDVTP